MLWCDHCARDFELSQLDSSYLCCSLCGKVIFEVLFSIDPAFVKNAAGQVVPDKGEEIIRSEFPSDDDEDLPDISENDIEPVEIHKDDDLGQDDSNGGGDIAGTSEDDFYYDSEGEAYDYCYDSEGEPYYYNDDDGPDGF